MFKQLRPAVVSFLALTVITGAAYPAVVTLIGKVAFPQQSTGSMLLRDGHTIGSELIAQPFTDAKYFWPRPSAANYDATAGSGSNLGPTNPALVDAVKARVAALRAAGGDMVRPVPVDLVTASASGLDPHISVAAADYQLARVATARQLPVDQVRHLLDLSTEPATLGCLGDARVNVLRLNDMLDHGATAAAPARVAFGGRIYGFLPGAR